MILQLGNQMDLVFIRVVLSQIILIFNLVNKNKIFILLNVGGRSPGTAPPLALDPLLAKLTNPTMGVNPHGDGLLFIVFLPCVQVTRPEVSRVGGARREEGRIMTPGEPSPGGVRRLDAYCRRGPS